MRRFIYRNPLSFRLLLNRGLWKHDEIAATITNAATNTTTSTVCNSTPTTEDFAVPLYGFNTQKSERYSGFAAGQPKARTSLGVESLRQGVHIVDFRCGAWEPDPASLRV